MIAFVSASVAHTNDATLALSVPEGTAAGDILVAAVAATAWLPNTITLTPPDGWETVASVKVADGFRLGVYWRRAASGPASYDWTSDAGATDYRTLNGCILAYRGCISAGSPVDVFSNDAYTTYNTTARAGSVTATARAGMSVCVGMFRNGRGSFTPPDGYTERVDHAYTVTRGSALTAADCLLAAIGATGDKDFTFSRSEETKHAVQLILRPAVVLPDTPTILAPERMALIAPESTPKLRAEGIDPLGYPVSYRWEWRRGTDTWDIGTSASVPSGTAAEVDWDLAWHEGGEYELRCWTVDAEGRESASPATRRVSIGYCIVVDPPDGVGRVAGATVFLVHARLDAPGDMVVELELDRESPPDAGNPDYLLLQSDPTDQDEIVALSADLERGRWYYRARVVEA